jgi:outer membrane lipase/esterase
MTPYCKSTRLAGTDKPATKLPDQLLRCTIAASALLLSPTGFGAALGDFGQNQLQQSTGTAVQTTCGKMIPIKDTLTGDTQQLFFRCGELVQTGNELTPDDPGGTGNSLGISEDELALALQNVAPEETEAMGAGLTDTSQDQLASLQDRLQFIRTGTSTLPIAGVHWSGEDLNGGTAGSDSFSRLGAFITGIYGTGDKGETNKKNGVENGFDYDAYGFTTGMDYRFTDAFVAGIGFGYIESEVEFDHDFGDTETEGYNLALYSTWYKGDFFFEGSIVYGQYEYDSSRNIDYSNNNPDNPSGGENISQRVSSETDGDSLSWSLGAGYNVSQKNRNFTLSALLTGLDADIDGYSESGSELAMELGDQEVESLQSIISAQAAFNFSTDFGVVVPFASIAWHHEFDDEEREINARYVFDPNKTDAENTLRFTTDPGDEDYYLLSLGTYFVLKVCKQIFFNYDTALGLDEVSSHVFTVGLRMEF